MVAAMTIEEVCNIVATIETVAHDDEKAHGMEDALYEAVLKAIADNTPNAALLAHYALKTKDIDFARYCA